MKALCSVAAWLLATAIVVVHIVPPAYRPVSAASHSLEHMAIFFALGLAYGVGYQHRLRVLVLALPAFCAAIEIAQIWIPGRHPRLTDFLIDTLAVLVGVGTAFILTSLRRAPS
jgi:VanZ family protein